MDLDILWGGGMPRKFWARGGERKVSIPLEEPQVDETLARLAGVGGTCVKNLI